MNIYNHILSIAQTKMPGKVFGYQDLELSSGSMNNAARALSLMVKKGEIVRVMKGRYICACPILDKQPPVNEIDTINAICFFRNKTVGYETGPAIWQKMNLVPVLRKRIVFYIAAKNPRPAQQHHGFTIRFTRARLDPSKYKISVLQLLDAIAHFNSLCEYSSARNIIAKIVGLVKLLTDSEKQLLSDYSLAYNASTRAIVGAVLQELGCENLCDRLRNTLNPLTFFRIGINEKILSGASEWNFR